MGTIEDMPLTMCRRCLRTAPLWQIDRDDAEGLCNWPVPWRSIKLDRILLSRKGFVVYFTYGTFLTSTYQKLQPQSIISTMSGGEDGMVLNLEMPTEGGKVNPIVKMYA